MALHALVQEIGDFFWVRQVFIRGELEEALDDLQERERWMQ